MPLLRPLSADDAIWPDFVPPLLLGWPAGDGWLRLAEMAEPGSPVLTRALAAMAEVRGYADARTIGAGFALITTAGLAPQVFAAVDGRDVPVVLAEGTWWQVRRSANVTAIAVEDRPETVSPWRIGEALHATLDGLYAEIHRQTGFPVRAQWSLLTSAIGHWLTEYMAEDHVRAVATGEAIFASDELLNIVKPRVTWLELDGRRRAFTTRRVCCFNYRGRGGNYCSSQCPIVPAAERLSDAIQFLRAG